MAGHLTKSCLHPAKAGGPLRRCEVAWFNFPADARIFIICLRSEWRRATLRSVPLEKLGSSPCLLRQTFLRLMLCALATLSSAPGLAQPARQNQNPGAPALFQPRAGRHVSPTRPAEATGATSPPASAEEVIRWPLAPATMAPTRSSFLATWKPVIGVTGYRMDVSTSRSFSTYVSGYHNFDVGNLTSCIVSRLQPGTTYYYRVRPYNSSGAGSDSQVMTDVTAIGSGLVINPTFDSSITGNPNSAAIQAMITRAIALYQPLFSDPNTVEIFFRYSNTQPDGSPIGTNVAQSNFVVYGVTWGTYLTSLRGDAQTSNDSSANADLPSAALSTNISPSGAGGRAIGLDTPPAMFADGHVNVGGPYDGIVTLNSTEPYQFVRPPSSGNYDAQTATEHEMDEVLGFGSYLGSGSSDLRPQDLFSWSSPGVRNHIAIGTRYFSIDNGNTNIVNFNQGPKGDFGDWLSESCPQTHPYVQNAFGCKGQFANVTSTSPEGINLDVIGYDLTSAIISPGPTVLGNISTRGEVETGDQVLIGGFIVTGTEPKKVIVRAIGPSLPVAGALSDPFLELHDASGAVIVSNDNWNSDQAAEIIATGIPPTNLKESAIVVTLDAGSYTAIVRGAKGETGVALVEVYDLDQSVDSKLANISTRGLVGTADNVLIGGFIILGNDPATAVVRAIGPSLAAAGVVNPLQDPTLELHDSNGTTIVSNDNWRTDQESEILATGIAPTDDAESAIVTTLTPASYTAIVSGKNNTTGVALVEVYQLDN
jgi:hypothetical protein